MDMDFVDIEDPTDWPEALPHLHQLDAHLRCPICKEYFTTAMMLTSCGHNFCSLCIRRYLTTEKKCPSCRKSVDDSELLPNRLIDSITRSFRSNRKMLLDIVSEHFKITDKQRLSQLSSSPLSRRSQLAGPSQGNGATNDRNGQGPRRSTRLKRQKRDESSGGEPALSSARSVAVCQVSDGLDNDSGGNSEDDSEDYAPTPPKRSKPTTVSTPSNKVACPNCQRLVQYNSINLHLDRCLASGGSSKPPSSFSWSNFLGRQPQLPSTLPSNKTLPRPTKLVYSIMPEAKLRKMLKELGIPHHGDKHAMQARHSEWVTMYRANEDSSQPKPHTKLLVDLVRWEQAVMAGGSDRARTASASRAQPSPSSSQDSSVPAAGAANAHVEKYASSFAELVSQARSRLPAGAVRKTQVSVTLPGQEAETNNNAATNRSIEEEGGHNGSPPTDTTSASLPPPPPPPPSLALDQQLSQNKGKGEPTATTTVTDTV